MNDLAMHLPPQEKPGKAIRKNSRRFLGKYLRANVNDCPEVNKKEN
jgi:hypothetical protein